MDRSITSSKARRTGIPGIRTAVLCGLLVGLAGCASDPNADDARNAREAYKACAERVADRYIPQREIADSAVVNTALGQCDAQWRDFVDARRTMLQRRTRDPSDARRFAKEDALQMNIQMAGQIRAYVEQARAK